MAWQKNTVVYDWTLCFGQHLIKVWIRKPCETLILTWDKSTNHAFKWKPNWSWQRWTHFPNCKTFRFFALHVEKSFIFVSDLKNGKKLNGKSVKIWLCSAKKRLTLILVPYFIFEFFWRRHHFCQILFTFDIDYQRSFIWEHF